MKKDESFEMEEWEIMEKGDKVMKGEIEDLD